MASSGQNVNQRALVAETPEAVSQALIAATAGAPGYTVTTAGNGSIVLTRKYTPTWAIVVAVVGALFILIGLLLLLYKVTETVTITLVSSQGGTKVNVSGVGSQEMLTRIAAGVGSMNALDPSNLDAVRQAAPDAKTCPACAETVKAAARICRHCGFKFQGEYSDPAPT